MTIATAFIGLGSNLGNRRRLMERAIAELSRQRDIWVGSRSSFYETAPVGGPADQSAYLNAALEVRTSLAPAKLIGRLLEIERLLGRERRERNGPRTIDLDLLLFEDAVLDTAEAIVPHPRMHERLFVLVPLTEIAPRRLHPPLGRSISELLGAAGGDMPLDYSAPGPGIRRLRELEGLQALVTGSTSGIGRAVALELAAAGAGVIVHGRSAERAEDVMAECQARGVPVGSIIADLEQAGEVEQLADTAWSRWNGLDILVAAAGADTLTGESRDWSFSSMLYALWNVDVLSAIQLTRDLGGRMRRQGIGTILTIGWDQAGTGMEGDSGQLFAASKGAIEAFTRSLAVDLAPEVRANCLAPGWIRTAWGEGATAKWQERVRAETPLGRWGVPADVASTARWLVSPAASFITGQTIRVNGGAVR